MLRDPKNQLPRKPLSSRPTASLAANNSFVLPAETHVGFILLSDYSMIAFANAVEALRMANYISRRPLYHWTVVSAAETAAVASNGLTTLSTGDISNLSKCNLVFICGGVNVRRSTNASVCQMLRKLANRNVVMGALCTGSFALAKAGLLDDHRCAIHWENLASISEEFPKVNFSTEVFVVDRNRITCSGGTAPLHLMLHLVRTSHGAKLARDISEQFIVERMRDSKDHQRIPQPERIGPSYRHLVEAAEIMACNIEDPLPMDDLSRSVGLSLRQMERVFHRYFSMTPSQYYMNLRLRRAQEFLTHSSMPIMAVTVACGFQSSSHFCKAYRSLFARSPSEERRSHGAQAASVR